MGWKGGKLRWHGGRDVGFLGGGWGGSNTVLFPEEGFLLGDDAAGCHFGCGCGLVDVVVVEGVR